MDGLKRGERVVDVRDGRAGTVVARATTGQIFPDRPSYPHAYDVAYDDGTESRRMEYHLRRA